MMKRRPGYQWLFLVTVLVGFSSCGSGDDSEENDKHIGEFGSLHLNAESFALAHLADRENGVLISEATPSAVEPEGKVISATEKGIPGRKSQTADVTPTPEESALYNQFVAYPSTTSSARTIHAVAFSSRDACLRHCAENPNCGSVTYMQAIGGCYLHGPNMPWYTLHTVPIQTNAGKIVGDTYVIPSRQGDPSYEGNFLLDLQAGRYGARGPVVLKFLYTDMTASAWITFAEKGYITRKMENVGVGKDVPFKDIEAVIVAVDQDAGNSSILAIYNGYWDGNSVYGSLPIEFRFLNYFFSFNDSDYNGITVNPNCKNEAGDRCVDTLVLPILKDANSGVSMDPDAKGYQQLHDYRRQFTY